MNFDLHIGIDYSGRETPTSRTQALQVYAAFDSEEPRRILPPASTQKTYKNWCRKEIAEWLIEQARGDDLFIAGIDHAFSFPQSYFDRHQVRNWDTFLADFCKHWPTDRDGVTVESLRTHNRRTGSSNELRLTDTWSSSAKSVFWFNVRGQVAKSTHAGMPWLAHIRREVGQRVHGIGPALARRLEAEGLMGARPGVHLDSAGYEAAGSSPGLVHVNSSNTPSSARLVQPESPPLARSASFRR